MTRQEVIEFAKEVQAVAYRHKEDGIYAIGDGYIQMNEEVFKKLFQGDEWKIERGGSSIHVTVSVDGAEIKAVF